MWSTDSMKILIVAALSKLNMFFTVSCYDIYHLILQVYSLQHLFKMSPLQPLCRAPSHSFCCFFGASLLKIFPDPPQPISNTAVCLVLNLSKFPHVLSYALSSGSLWSPILLWQTWLWRDLQLYIARLSPCSAFSHTWLLGFNLHTWPSQRRRNNLLVPIRLRQSLHLLN